MGRNDFVLEKTVKPHRLDLLQLMGLVHTKIDVSRSEVVIIY